MSKQLPEVSSGGASMVTAGLLWILIVTRMGCGILGLKPPVAGFTCNVACCTLSFKPPLVGACEAHTRG